MADITVHDNAMSGTSIGAPVPTRAQVFTTSLIGYEFYLDETSRDAFYKKTTDGGETWGSAVTVRTGSVSAIDVWYDKWTPGGSGVVIHIAMVDFSAADVFYRSLTTSTDTLGGSVTVLAGASASAGDTLVSIAKARGGNIGIVYNLDDGTESGFEISTDGGATFGAVASPVEVDDRFALYPGNYADNQDFDLLYVDSDATEMTLKTYDNSEDSWSESAAIATGLGIPTDPDGFLFNASVRHSDGHLLVALDTGYDGAGDDLRFFDINGAASITEKTALFTNKDDTCNPAVCINQTTGRIRVAINGNPDGSEGIGTSTTIWVFISDNGGTSWLPATQYSASAANYLGLHCDLGGTATRFIPAFVAETSHDLFVNFDNSVAIGAADGASSPGNSGNAPGRGRGNPNPGGGNGGGGNGGGQGGGGQGALRFAFSGRRKRQR